MNDPITYVYRHRLPQYNSIEEVFSSVQGEISNTRNVQSTEMRYSGAMPSTVLKNVFDFKRRPNHLYHITGDVHYMALKTGKHTVLTIHDVKSAYVSGFLKRFYIKLFWFWLPALVVKKITVISEFTKTELERLIPFAKHKIQVVYNPVKAELKPTPYKFNKEKPTILLIGTKANKNLERTLKALEQIKCQLIIIGELSSSQENLLTELDIKFENKSNLPFDDIIKCYVACDLMCFASTYEGFGMPIIEAQAVGRPVLTSNIGAMKEVSNNSTCLVDPYEVESIREGIKKILDDDTYRNSLIEKGFENAQRFQLRHIAKQYCEIYDQILS